jgi:DNA-binding transcriptional LysR family regulator
MQNEDWDIFRYIIAVAESGSAIAAARKLGVNGSTVLRRISRFEEDRGVRLFDRLQTGYTPTLQCEALLRTAREIQESVAIIDRDIAGQDVRFEGPLTVTTTDTFLEDILPDILMEFSSANPLIRLEVTVTNQRLSLTSRDADVAIRVSRKPPEHLVGQCVSAVSLAIYGAASLAAELPPEPTLEDLKPCPWIGTGESMSGSPVAAWMERNIPATSIRLTADTFPSIRSCIQNGAVGVLPCFLGDSNGKLKQLRPPIRDMETALWVLVHPDVRRSAKVSAFTRHVARRLREKSHRIAPDHA